MFSSTLQRENRPPNLGIDYASLYWHVFCHCTGHEIAFCGAILVKPKEKVGGASDGAPPVESLNKWDRTGEFCPACVNMIGSSCTAGGCGCPECRVVLERRWGREVNLKTRLEKQECDTSEKT